MANLRQRVRFVDQDKATQEAALDIVGVFERRRGGPERAEPSTVETLDIVCQLLNRHVARVGEGRQE